MQVDDDLEAVLLGPRDGLLEVRQLTLNVRLSARYVPSPETNGDADVIQAMVPRCTSEDVAEKFRRERPKEGSVWVNREHVKVQTLQRRWRRNLTE